MHKTANFQLHAQPATIGCFAPINSGALKAYRLGQLLIDWYLTYAPDTKTQICKAIDREGGKGFEFSKQRYGSYTAIDESLDASIKAWIVTLWRLESDAFHLWNTQHLIGYMVAFYRIIPKIRRGKMSKLILHF